MKPGKLPKPIVITRGLYWPGLGLDCYEDEAETILTDLTGWEPFMDAATVAGATPSFSFTAGLGETEGRVNLLPMEATITAGLTVGTYKADLAFMNADGKPVGPFIIAEVIVQNSITRPT